MSTLKIENRLHALELLLEKVGSAARRQSIINHAMAKNIHDLFHNTFKLDTSSIDGLTRALNNLTVGVSILMGVETIEMVCVSDLPETFALYDERMMMRNPEHESFQGKTSSSIFHYMLRSIFSALIEIYLYKCGYRNEEINPEKVSTYALDLEYLLFGRHTGLPIRGVLFN